MHTTSPSLLPSKKLKLQQADDDGEEEEEEEEEEEDSEYDTNLFLVEKHTSGTRTARIEAADVTEQDVEGLNTIYNMQLPGWKAEQGADALVDSHYNDAVKRYNVLMYSHCDKFPETAAELAFQQTRDLAKQIGISTERVGAWGKYIEAKRERHIAEGCDIFVFDRPVFV